MTNRTTYAYRNLLTNIRGGVAGSSVLISYKSSPCFSIDREGMDFCFYTTQN